MSSPFSSLVWRHFKLNPDNPTIGICQICLKTKTEKDSSILRKNNTTNLWNHLEADHYQEFMSIKSSQDKSKQATLNVSSQNKLTFNVGLQSKYSIDRYIAEMIVSGCHPYRIVEEEGFKNLISYLCPNYQLPGREFFKTLINKMYDENVEKIKKELIQAEFVTLTSDLWTGINQESYSTITAHYIHNQELKSYVLDTKPFGSIRHTAENISIVFKATIFKWDLEKKIAAIVTDNAANIVNAVNYTDNLSIRCSAHTIQLAINDAFKNNNQIDDILSKCKTVVSHFKHSSLAAAKLQVIQKQLHLKENKLIQEVSTRWNSKYYMIERLFEQKSSLNLYTSENPETDLPQLTNQEWRIIDGLINILEPMEASTRILSGDKYSTISLIIPLITGLIVSLKSRKSSEIAVNKFRDHLVDSIKRRFADVEKNCLISTATLLDPRVKNTCFIEDENKRKAVKRLQDLLKANFQSSKKGATNEIERLSSDEQPSAKRPCFDLREFIIEQQCIEDQSENNEYVIELENYLKQPIILKKNDTDLCDILDWWENNKYSFPNLYSLTKKYLSIPATSAPCERIFSKAGEILSKKRSRLNPKNFNCLLFLMHNINKLRNVK